MHKHFFTTPEIYEQLRAEIDQSRGFPNHIATTCIPPADNLYTDEQGNCYIHVNLEYVVEKFSNTEGVFEIIDKDSAEVSFY